MVNVMVKDPRAPIPFHGTMVPFAFIATFAKPNHGQCNGRGVLTFRRGGSQETQICPCAITRARKALIASGKEAFETAGRAAFPLPTIGLKTD